MRIPGQTLSIFTLATLLTLADFPAQAQENELPKVTVEGLHLVPDAEMAIVYADPQADLSGYNRVNLLDAYVAFRKNWERDHRRKPGSMLPPSASDMEKIKTTMANEFKGVFTRVLEEGGFPVVEETGEDVLLVRPAIINLDPTAPEMRTSSMTQVYVDSAGEMTLYIELYDSQTGDLLAKAVDRKADRGKGYYTWANSVSNKQASERILKGWANILLDALNEAKE